MDIDDNQEEDIKVNVYQGEDMNNEKLDTDTVDDGDKIVHSDTNQEKAVIHSTAHQNNTFGIDRENSDSLQFDAER